MGRPRSAFSIAFRYIAPRYSEVRYNISQCDIYVKFFLFFFELLLCYNMNMKKVLLLLLNRVFSNNPSIWIFSILLIFLAIILRKLYKKLLRAGKSLKLWRILCFIPLALALFHFAFFRIKGNFWSTSYYYLWLYIASLVLALPALTSLWPRINKILHPLIITFCILCGLYTLYKPLVWDSAMRNHTRQS